MHSAPEEMAANKRFAARKSRNMPAYIDTQSSILGKKAPLINCIVKDVSSSGAMLQLGQNVSRRWTDGMTGIPNRFILRMPADGVEIDCEMAWRRETTFGVRFSSPARLLKQTEEPEPIAAKVIPGAARTFGRRS